MVIIQAISQGGLEVKDGTEGKVREVMTVRWRNSMVEAHIVMQV